MEAFDVLGCDHKSQTHVQESSARKLLKMVPALNCNWSNFRRGKVKRRLWKAGVTRCSENACCTMSSRRLRTQGSLTQHQSDALYEQHQTCIPKSVVCSLHSIYTLCTPEVHLSIFLQFEKVSCTCRPCRLHLRTRIGGRHRLKNMQPSPQNMHLMLKTSWDRATACCPRSRVWQSCCLTMKLKHC